jgi:hypothetical protein
MRAPFVKSIVSVSGVGAKPPELPIRPEVEFRVPLFPLGEEFAEKPIAKPQQPVPAAKVELLEVMPRIIESLEVMPRTASVPTKNADTPMQIEVIESSATRSSLRVPFPNRDPELPVRVFELNRLPASKEVAHRNPD